MVNKKSWREFRDSGLLWFVNTILHMFGWAIVINFKNYDKEDDDGEIVDIYPARVDFRGFGEESVEKGYKKVHSYMKNNIESIYNETFKGEN